MSVTKYKIISVDRTQSPEQERGPVGVKNEGLLPVEPVRLDDLVQIWSLTTVDDPSGRFIFRLGIGNYTTSGVMDERVVASNDSAVDLVWHSTCREEYGNACTIELADDSSKGWTIPSDLSIHPPVLFRDLRPFYHGQLFRFVPADE